MDALPRRMRWIAATGLAGCAVVGLLIGATRAAPTGSDYRAGAVDGDGVPSAKAIVAPTGPALDEAAIRKIAREEAQAALVKPAPKHADAPADASHASPKAASGDNAQGETDPADKPVRPRRHAPTATQAVQAATPSAPAETPPAAPVKPASPPDQY